MASKDVFIPDHSLSYYGFLIRGSAKLNLFSQRSFVYPQFKIIYGDFMISIYLSFYLKAKNVLC